MEIKTSCILIVFLLAMAMCQDNIGVHQEFKGIILKQGFGVQLNAGTPLIVSGTLDGVLQALALTSGDRQGFKLYMLFMGPTISVCGSGAVTQWTFEFELTCTVPMVDGTYRVSINYDRINLFSEIARTVSGAKPLPELTPDLLSREGEFLFVDLIQDVPASITDGRIVLEGSLKYNVQFGFQVQPPSKMFLLLFASTDFYQYTFEIPLTETSDFLFEQALEVIGEFYFGFSLGDYSDISATPHVITSRGLSVPTGNSQAPTTLTSF